MDMDQQHQQSHHHNVGFSQRRNASLQRSQDSGALTDWSGGSRGSPTRQSLHSLERDDRHKYVTVLTVNGGLDLQDPQVQTTTTTTTKDDPVHHRHSDLDDFVTVLSVGVQPKNLDDDNEDETAGPSSIGVGSVCLSLSGFVEEVACVTRLPGQKLGFGLKFDGGNECSLPIQRLFIQSCAEGSPASNVHCSWGRLVEADEIVEIDGANIRNTLNRLQVVEMLKDSQQDVLSLKIRHYWDDGKRADIMEHLNSFSQPAVHHPPAVVIEAKPPVTRKVSVRHQQQQERAVDVPEELLIQSVMRLGQRKDGGWTKGHHPLIDEPPPVLINGNRVAASGAVTVVSTPSKPPRNNRPQHSRSFNAAHHHNHKDVDPHLKMMREEGQMAQAPATLPRTKLGELTGGQQPEPKERQRRSILTVNADDWGIPQPAEVYTNLIAEEDKRMMMMMSSIEASSSSSATESESESNSSVSTVVDNWSVLSSSSGGDPFGDFGEHEEFREFYHHHHQPSADVNLSSGNHQLAIVGDQQLGLPDVVTPESTLSVLIEPPETFLDPGPTSISPTLSSEDSHLHLHHQQDASSDSGASSGGSELHLGESDEELRAFQQMESALEMEKLERDRHAISGPTAVEFHNNIKNNNDNFQVSGVIERSDDRTQQQQQPDTSAICVPDTQYQQQQQPAAAAGAAEDEPAVECQPEEPVK
ncbi:hypothetical protein DAPPUDRAFT_94924 [Daphnia pulex]|uniref:PDZ domain-containing protein n=1 Tax=Daphnia pulex TaxID=6669 RepID=E9FTG7_DAPPU|nr:hypothetical protein DAPPUDRAFT_94924 [Daphnia pulex]|eukprot:EFX89638.1 hypothetical protein DAPPUDRAFT_94924 [Daphnia pulex]